ncbi:SDR family oxidoreductase [bacterium]|nr:SDR family oxidoreductase [bacterium]
MRLVVVGASGRTGRLVVEQALGHGQDVVAVARDPDKIASDSERLVVLQGDVRDIDSLRIALADADAVVSAIGVAPADSVDVHTTGIVNLLQAMAELEVDRLAVVSAAGTFARSDRNLTAGYRLLVRTTMRRLYDDLEGMEQRIMASGVVWTIVRAAGLTDGPLTGEYRLGEHGRPLAGGKRISRADLAAFLLKSVETQRWARKAVTIAY